jgi:hypothetical protein
MARQPIGQAINWAMITNRKNSPESFPIIWPTKAPRTFAISFSLLGHEYRQAKQTKAREEDRNAGETADQLRSSNIRPV